MISATTYLVGPLRVMLEPTLPTFERRIDEQLRVFSSPWEHAPFQLRVLVEPIAGPARSARGSYLTCSRMNVDADRGRIYATTLCGARAERDFGVKNGEHWTIGFPMELIATPAIDELEDLIGLALVSGWRASGWMPVHGAAVMRDDQCLILCATSGGGKSTLTAALVREGWRTLGDDKLLLRMNDGGTPEVAALQHSFNLHPKTRVWFPEVGNLEGKPRYSAWTEKRKVHPEDVWPGRTALLARPTHVVRVRRDPEPERPMTIAALGEDELFRTLIGQVAIPHDREIATRALRTVASIARSGLRGLDVVIGEGAYQTPNVLATLEAAL